jgi:hypothetical protein
MLLIQRDELQQRTLVQADLLQGSKLVKHAALVLFIKGEGALFLHCCWTLVMKEVSLLAGQSVFFSLKNKCSSLTPWQPSTS